MSWRHLFCPDSTPNHPQSPPFTSTFSSPTPPLPLGLSLTHPTPPQSLDIRHLRRDPATAALVYTGPLSVDFTAFMGLVATVLDKRQGQVGGIESYDWGYFDWG